MGHGIVNYYIETVGTSRIEFTWQDYLTLLAARIYPYTPGTDVEFDLHEVVEGPPVSGCSSIAGRFVLRMRHHRDYIHEGALSGLIEQRLYRVKTRYFPYLTHTYCACLRDRLALIY